MGTRDRHDPGTFSWIDLATTDVEAAKSLYADLFGWQHEGRPMPGGEGTYWMAQIDGRIAAGLASVMAPDQPPAWSSYVTVDDADAAATKAGELGGNVAMGPFDVGDAGRMAVIQDPTGAFFSVWQPKATIGAEIVNGPGALTLNQLNTRDPERAERFYTDLFGWRFERMPGQEPPYWGIYNGDRVNAGMMQMDDRFGFGDAPPHWLVYLGSDDLDAAVETIKAGGGEILLERLSVPGGDIVVAQDAQGAVFGMFEGEYDD